MAARGTNAPHNKWNWEEHLLPEEVAEVKVLRDKAAALLEAREAVVSRLIAVRRRVAQRERRRAMAA